MRFVIEKKALYISIKKSCLQLEMVVYCSIYTKTDVKCNKQAAISSQGTEIYMHGATHTGPR